MSTFRLLQQIGVMLSVLIASLMSVSAQVQYPAPTDLTATAQGGANGMAGYVVLTWKGITSAPTPLKYYVYQASGETEDVTKFTKVAAIPHSANTRENTYTATIQGLKAGVYTFFVKGYWDGGTEGPRSLIKVVEVKGTVTKGLRFVSAPVLTGTVTKAYYYDANAESDNSATISYVLVSGPQGMTINKENGKITWEKPVVGRYEISIAAVQIIDGKEVVVKQNFVLVITEGDGQAGTVKFVSQPVTTGYVGVKYTYVAKAIVVGVNTTPMYKLDGQPAGMVIDQTTGVITWENPVAGTYRFVVLAKAVVNGVEVVATQVVELTIKEKNTEAPLCAKIKGMVAYEGNVNETVNGVVTAWRQEVIKKENGNPTTTYRPVYKAEIKNGSYVLMLPAGTYKIRVEGSGMVGEWYDDVVELADAKDVVVECNTIKEIDFKVAMRAKPVMVVAEGRVFDAATNEPLKALVVFEAREKSASADSRYMRVVAETREDGTYRVELQSGVSYIGTARVLGKDNAANQYLVEFYNNTHDVLSATSIKLTETKGGFDFPMDKRESFNNGFGGTMKNAYTNAGVAGKVVAYRLAAYVSEKGDTLAKKLEATTVETDQDGNYSFTNMIPGDYVVFGGPAKRPAMPGWMVLGATAVPEWGKATRVSVGDVMVAIQYDILLDTVKTDKGKGRVRGHVYDKRGGIVKSGADKTQEASAVLGAFIIARDEDGNIVDFALSEDEGSFDMTEVAMGNIIIVADRVGFEPTTQTVAIEATNADQVIAIGMMKNTTTGIDVPVDEVGASVNLWPNPTSASASVQFTAQPGSATIRVVSLSGVELAVQQYTLDGGMQTLTVNTSTLPAGMVMVHITNGSTSFALPLNIVR
ncbi:MAG: putative Ig domain-containing protein [Ignavibacteria bacterium]|jgi:hypothetical protein